jgi:hypothetical protein
VARTAIAEQNVVTRKKINEKPCLNYELIQQCKKISYNINNFIMTFEQHQASSVRQ